jgi:hypothetical protein
MKKILDILIIILLTVLIINLFNKNPEDSVKQEKVLISLSDKDYTIPAEVKLKITNNTKADIKIDTCKNITINNSF